jgi:hypothetical protein
MEAYKSKAVKIYVSYFLKDRITDFENRLIKAKKDAMSHVQSQIDLYKNNPDEMFYWTNIKNSLEKI